METEIKFLNKTESHSISDDKATEEILYCIDDFNNQLEKIDSCEGVGLGIESRLITKMEVYYDLTYQKETVHQSILIIDGINRFNKRDKPRNQRLRTVDGDIKIDKEPITMPENKRESIYSRILKYFRPSNE